MSQDQADAHAQVLAAPHTPTSSAEPDGSVNQRIFHTSSIWYGVPNSGETWYVDFDLGWNGTASNNIPGILGGNPLENFHSARCVK